MHVGVARFEPQTAWETCQRPCMCPQTSGRGTSFCSRDAEDPSKAVYLSLAQKPSPCISPSAFPYTRGTPWSPTCLKFKLRKSKIPGVQSFRVSSNVELSKRVKTPEEQAAEFKNALRVLTIGSEPKPTTSAESSTDDAYLRLMNWALNRPFKTQASRTYSSKARTPLQLLLCKHMC